MNADFWNEGTKSILTALGSFGAFWIGGRKLRQIDRRKQAESVGEAAITEADSESQVRSIANFERLALLAEERAGRAEARELLAVQRADDAQKMMYEAQARADASERRAKVAEADVVELKTRIERLEAAIGKGAKPHE